MVNIIILENDIV